MTDHQQAAIEAANRELRDYSAVCYCPGSPEYVDSLDKIDEGDAAERAIAAAEPHLRKQVRAEVAAEIRASLPRDLAASAQDLDGWFSDMTGDLNIVVEVDEDMTPVGYGFELEAATGTIDLHHLADIAARIAEGGNHA